MRTLGHSKWERYQGARPTFRPTAVEIKIPGKVAEKMVSDGFLFYFDGKDWWRTHFDRAESS